jgi:RHS repeat-associated protein
MDDSKRIATDREGYDFGDSTPAIKYNLDDHLGSSNVSIDDTGALVSFEEYYPFGETSFGSYGKKRYRFCGKEKDEESGLYYYGARYYSPWTCRFVSVDPKSLKYVHQSPFVYADNNPICKIDHNGEGTGEGEGKPPAKPAVPEQAINGVKEQFAKFIEQQKIESTKPVNQKLAEIANKKLDKNNIKSDNTAQHKDKLTTDIKNKQTIAAPKQATLSAKDPYSHLNSAERGLIVNNPVIFPLAVGGAIATGGVVGAPTALTLITGTPIERFSNAAADVVSQYEMLSMQDSLEHYNITSTLAAFGLPREPYVSSWVGNTLPITPSDIFGKNKILENSIFGKQKLSDAASKTIIGGTGNLFGDQLKLGDDIFGQFSSNFFGNQFENIFNLLKSQKTNQDSIQIK